MDTLSYNAEAYQADLEHLLTRADTRAVRGDLKRYFQRLLEVVAASARKLEAAEQQDALALYENWTFDDLLTRPSFLGKLLGSVDILLQLTTTQQDATSKHSELLELYESLRTAVLDYRRRKRALDERILTAWRKEHPHFSSMGIIDSEIQSDELRDLIDRR